MLHRIALIMLLCVPVVTEAQSFSDKDITRILLSHELGAAEQLQRLKIELIDSEDGFKLLQNAPEHAATRMFVEFGRQTNSAAIEALEKISKDSEFSSLYHWALTNDRILGIANAALLTGWGLHSDDPRYNDPDYPDTLAFMEDSSLPWANRANAKEAFKQWCDSLCVNVDSQEFDKRVLAPRYLEVVKQILPKEP